MHRYHDPSEAHHHHHPAHGREGGWGGTLLLLVTVLVIGYAATGLYTVQPNEVAVVRRCGKLLDEIRGPGLHVGLPYGFDRVDKLRLMELKRVGVGIGLADRSVGRRLQPQQAEVLTGDRNLILISAVVQYRIAAPEKYLLATEDVPRLVEDATGSALTGVISSMSVDHVLTTERIQVQNNVQKKAQELLQRYGVGVEIVSVSLEGTAPPQEVAAAFRDVISAREDKQRLEHEADGYKNRLAPQARGESKRMKLAAQAYADELARMAEGDAARFTQMADELQDGRQLTTRRLILETMEKVLPRLKKVVVDSEAGEHLDLGIYAGESQEAGP
jgi:membrane protease subunit HflK